MKLPNRENAYIQPQKIYDYLLSKIHPVGMWKAKFFRAHGFTVWIIDEGEDRPRLVTAFPV